MSDIRTSSVRLHLVSPKAGSPQSRRQSVPSLAGSIVRLCVTRKNSGPSGKLNEEHWARRLESRSGSSPESSEEWRSHVVEKTALFNPVKGRRAFEEVSSEVKKLIIQGVLKAGDRLPSEMDLANQFHVGRQTIREALRVLELSGFIATQKGYGGGAIIKDSILNRITSLFMDAFQMEKVNLEELTIARFKIEKVVLEDAVEYADDEDLAALKENIEEAKKRMEMNLMATAQNIEFHRLLSKAAKNQVFVIVVDSISALLEDLLSRLKPDLGVSLQAVDSHERILDALIRKDRQKAVQLLEEHLLAVRDRLQSLRNDPLWESPYNSLA